MFLLMRVLTPIFIGTFHTFSNLVHIRVKCKNLPLFSTLPSPHSRLVSFPLLSYFFLPYPLMIFSFCREGRKNLRILDKPMTVKGLAAPIRPYVYVSLENPVLTIGTCGRLFDNYYFYQSLFPLLSYPTSYEFFLSFTSILFLQFSSLKFSSR